MILCKIQKSSYSGHLPIDFRLIFCYSECVGGLQNSLQAAFIYKISLSICHCEPVCRLVWQSVLLSKYFCCRHDPQQLRADHIPPVGIQEALFVGVGLQVEL